MKKFLFVVVTVVVIYFVGSYFGWWGGPSPCELVTQADVEAALGRPVRADNPIAKMKRPDCRYMMEVPRVVKVTTGPGAGSTVDVPTGKDTVVAVTVTVKKGKCEGLAQYGNPQGRPVRGLGDEAIDSNSALYVHKGGTCFAIEAAPSVRQTLAKNALERLTE